MLYPLGGFARDRTLLELGRSDPFPLNQYFTDGHIRILVCPRAMETALGVLGSPDYRRIVRRGLIPAGLGSDSLGRQSVNI